jgi:hypothetical protein
LPLGSELSLLSLAFQSSFSEFLRRGEVLCLYGFHGSGILGLVIIHSILNLILLDLFQPAMSLSLDFGVAHGSLLAAGCLLPTSVSLRPSLQTFQLTQLAWFNPMLLSNLRLWLAQHQGLQSSGSSASMLRDE